MNEKMPLVITVTSGKGGVGKTNMAVNLATVLARTSRVILMDADLGLANVDVLLGLTPPRDIMALFNEGTPMGEILFPTPYGFSILPAASGDAMLNLGTGQKLELLEAMDGVADGLDYLVVDTGAGISDTVLYFAMAAQERLVVLTPEPTSLADAYALVKVLKVTHGVEHFRVCINMARDRATAMELFARLCEACDQFLSGVSLDLAGIIPADPRVRAAVMEQKPFTALFPDCPASLAVSRMALATQGWGRRSDSDGNIKFFWKKLLFR